MTVKKKARSIRWKVLHMLFFILLFTVIPYTNVLSSEPVIPCEIPDTNPTVIIDGCDSGVNNFVVDQTCTVSDEIQKCACNSQNHGGFVSCVANLTNTLKKEGKIKGKEHGKIQSCAAKADEKRACSSEDEDIIAIPEEPFQFQFEKATDDLSLALQKVYAVYTVTPSPDIDMNELENLKQEGISYLREHPNEAADVLLAEASVLGQYDSLRFIGIFHLLGTFESEKGIQYLSDRIVSPLPDCSDGGGELCSHINIMQFSALKALGQISANGSALARSKILDAVKSEQLLIQREAIKLFYDNGGLSRWRAKREMERQLPVSKHYLLHEIY